MAKPMYVRFEMPRELEQAAIMFVASKAVGEQGRGHHGAAGATVPPGTEDRFLEIANRMIKDQSGGADSSAYAASAAASP